MKKILFTLFIQLFAIATFAQKVTFGVKAGINLSTQTRGDSDFPLYNENLTGFQFGGIIDIAIKNFALQSGLLFTTKGEKLEIQYPADRPGDFMTIPYKTKLNYLELPVNLVYKSKLNQTTTAFVGGGPYIGYGLSGTVSGYGESVAVSFHESNYFYTNNFRNPDYGINFTAGLELRQIIIGANFGLGLSSLSYPGEKLHNRVLSFSAGYRFK